MSPRLFLLFLFWLGVIFPILIYFILEFQIQDVEQLVESAYTTRIKVPHDLVI